MEIFSIIYSFKKKLIKFVHPGTKMSIKIILIDIMMLSMINVAFNIDDS